VIDAGIHQFPFGEDRGNCEEIGAGYLLRFPPLGRSQAHVANNPMRLDGPRGHGSAATHWSIWCMSIAVDTVFEGKKKRSPTTRTQAVLIADKMMLDREAAFKPAR
jgi:hypothetical protein